MKSIKIVKQKQAVETNETTAESKNSDEPTREIVKTIKSWIAESQQRRRNRPRSLPVLGILILVAFAVAMAQSPAR